MQLEKSAKIAYCPLSSEMRQWTDRKKKIDVPLFRSYVFVNLENYRDESSTVLAIPGVVKFIWWQGKPAEIKNWEIDAIRNFVLEHKSFELKVDFSVKVGESVNVTSGVFNGQVATVVSIGKKKAILEIQSLGWRLIATIGSEMTKLIEI